MDKPAKATDSAASPSSRSMRTVVVFSIIVVPLLVGLRAASEWSMMHEYGSDPQMGIWLMFLVVKLSLWSFGGAIVAALLVAVRKSRWGWNARVALFLVWAVTICIASWQYQRARIALADVASPSMSPARLQVLVHFDGIQAGYELDNRIAKHPNTSPQTLRELYERGQLGTLMNLAINPNTPPDILLELVGHSEVWVQRCLLRNPQLPPAVLRALKDHADAEIRQLVTNSDN